MKSSGAFFFALCFSRRAGGGLQSGYRRAGVEIGWFVHFDLVEVYQSWGGIIRFLGGIIRFLGGIIVTFCYIGDSGKFGVWDMIFAFFRGKMMLFRQHRDISFCKNNDFWG